MTTAGPILSSSAASALTVLSPPPASVVSVLGTSCARYWSSASSGNCRFGNGVGYSGPKRKFHHARSIGPRKSVGSRLGIGAAVAHRVDRRRIEAGAPAARMIHHVDRVALAHEPGRPAFAPVRRRLVGHAGVVRAVHHDDAGRPSPGRDAVVHVHLVDHDVAGRRRARSQRRAGILGLTLRPLTKKLPSSARFKGPPRLLANTG